MILRSVVSFRTVLSIDSDPNARIARLLFRRHFVTECIKKRSNLGMFCYGVRTRVGKEDKGVCMV